MEAKKNVPVKGAAKKLATRLKELGQKPTPKDLVNSIQDDRKKVARVKDLDA